MITKKKAMYAIADCLTALGGLEHIETRLTFEDIKTAVQELEKIYKRLEYETTNETGISKTS